MEKVRRRTDTATTVRRGSDGEGGAGGTGFFTATYWSAIPCAEEEDEVSAEVVV